MRIPLGGGRLLIAYLLDCLLLLLEREREREHVVRSLKMAAWEGMYDVLIEKIQISLTEIIFFRVLNQRPCRGNKSRIFCVTGTAVRGSHTMR